MATPYPAGAAPPHSASGMPHHSSSSSPTPQHWYEQKSTGANEESNLRSVTPAMNNTRGVVRNGTTPAYLASNTSPVPGSTAGSSSGAQSSSGSQYGRGGAPNRYYGSYNNPPPGHVPSHNDKPQPPSSTGLIRLSLRKPMGIVFEPMYDPNNSSLQRGVRICDLPRTGAAALSRKLEVGDELLSINDKTMSRLTFDEIMDFIIEADPEKVSLLFRRPRRESLTSRPLAKAGSSTPNSSTVKWVDDGQRKPDSKKAGTEKSEKGSSSKKSGKKDEDDTVQSVEESEPEPTVRKKGRNKKDPYESESFLDLLIDTICANPDNVCRDRNSEPRRGDDDYYSDEEDDRTFASQDDSTYVTYDSEPPKRSEKRNPKGQKRDDDSSVEETEDDTFREEEEARTRKNRDKKNGARLSPPKEAKRKEDLPSPKRLKEQVITNTGKYEDDATLETTETLELVKETIQAAVSPPPLGLAPKKKDLESKKEPTPIIVAPPEPEEDTNPAPIAEVEYDEQFDHGADVSVMESLGGPSLLIEKQRNSVPAVKIPSPPEDPIPSEIVNNFGKDFPADFGLTREQTAQRHPIKFYTYVVKSLLQENEPEKVRLLDKLLAKYKGREDHLVQKLSVRYNRTEESGTPTIPEEDEGKDRGMSFTNAVNRTKESAAAAATVQIAKARLQGEASAFETADWPEREEHEDEGKEVTHDEVSQGSDTESGSEYTGESIDGTSPAVIAQVSELLNYVYGKTSVPGQIDRVSTIMRAYEGREAVLLELLETKALIKANGEKENAANLPSFLRNSPALQHAIDDEENPANDIPPVSPLGNPNLQNHANQAVSGTLINDDISSMSGVSSPADNNNNNSSNSNNNGGKVKDESIKKTDDSESSKPMTSSRTQSKSDSATAAAKLSERDGKKKKGIFGGLFGGRKKGKEPEGTKKGRKLRQNPSHEGSI